MVTKNEHDIERAVRVALGVFLIGFGIYYSGVLGTVLAVIGVIPLLTGTIGWCPIYSIFNFSTRKGN